MALVLALLFRARLRLLPLAIALGARARSCSARCRVLGLPLTMASIAVLPVLLGLAVDYAIQYQAGGVRAPCRRSRPRRWPPAVGFLILLAVAGADGARVRGAAGGRRGRRARARPDGGHGGADARGAAAGVGRRAGALAARRGRARRRCARRCLARAGAGCVRSGRGALRAGRAPSRAACWRWRWPLAACGWVAGQPHQRRVRPAAARAAVARPRCATSTRCSARPAWRVRSTCVVEGRDLTDPKVIAWMRDYQDEVLTAPRLLGRARAARGAALCPGAVAAGPVPHAGAVGDARAGARAARRRAAVLLAGRDHARPAGPRCSPSGCGCSRWRASAR